MKRAPLFASLGVLWGLAAGCASEVWDNPYDPESGAYRSACSGAPAEQVGGCVFWEDFNRGLSRWRVNGSPAGMSAIRVVTESDNGEPTVLAVPGCEEMGSPGLETELDLPLGNLQLMVLWREAPEAAGELALTINGAAQFVSRETAGEKGFEGWFATVANVSPLAGRTVVLRLENASGQGARCATDGLYVARVHLRKLPE